MNITLVYKRVKLMEAMIEKEQRIIVNCNMRIEQLKKKLRYGNNLIYKDYIRTLLYRNN